MGWGGVNEIYNIYLYGLDGKDVGIKGLVLYAISKGMSKYLHSKRNMTKMLSESAYIGGVKEGQRVTFTVDAFPDDSFEGAVTQVRQQATTDSNVVTYEVVISAPNKDLKLKPGLTANVTIFTLEKNNVLAVPAKALRFQPNEAFLKKGEAIDDCEGDHKVWTKEGNTFKAHKVEIGTTNGVMTEITGGIQAGTEVLTDFNISGGENTEMGQQGGNPFMPRPRNNNNNRSSQGGNAAPQRQ